MCGVTWSCGVWTQGEHEKSTALANSQRCKKPPTTLQRFVNLEVLWSHKSKNISKQMEDTSNNLLECWTAKRRRVVNALRLASYRLLLRLVASFNTLLVSPRSTNTYAGFQNTLILICVSTHNNGDTKSAAQKHSLIFLNQSYELTDSGEYKVACNNFVI